MRVSVDFALNAPEKDIEGLLVAVASGTGAVEGGKQEIEVPWDGRRSLKLDLAPNVAWKVSLQADGYWSTTGVVVPGPVEQSVRLVLWPTGKIAGVLQPPRGAEMPEALTVRFQSAEIPETLLTCPVDPEGQWVCSLPADSLDYRLRVPTYVSRFHWGEKIEAGKTRTLAPFVLERGASLIGWVQVEGGNLDPERCRVHLLPKVAGEITNKNLERFERLAEMARVSRDGFFHLTGIPPGSYRVLVQQAGFAPAALSPVTVMRDAETEIREPLVLHRPFELEVRLTPTLDSMGEPWKVILWRLSEIPGSADQVAAGKAFDGFFTGRSLTPGRYLVRIQDSQGSQLKAEEIELSGSEILDLELPLVWVEGELSLGKEPLQGEIWFGGRFGSERVRMPSDSEGRFSGFLPREGEWKVYVEAPSPQVARYFYGVEVYQREGARSARVDLRLPDTRVRGVVVKPDGLRVQDALVRLYDAESSRDTVTYTNEEGEFSFAGLAEGRAVLLAEKSQAISDQVEVEISEDFEAPRVRLTVREHRAVVGRVVSPEGQALPGVAVAARGFSGGVPVLAPIHTETTDVEGVFRLRVPAEVTHLQITAYPPGYALKVLPVAPLPQEGFTIRPDTAAGALVLELPGPIDWNDAKGEKPALFIGGVVFSIQELLRWAQINGEGGQATAGEIRIPALPPGQHLACSVRVPAITDRLGLRPDEGCTQVQVVPFSEERVQIGRGRDAAPASP